MVSHERNYIFHFTNTLMENPVVWLHECTYIRHFIAMLIEILNKTFHMNDIIFNVLEAWKTINFSFFSLTELPLVSFVLLQNFLWCIHLLCQLLPYSCLHLLQILFNALNICYPWFHSSIYLYYIKCFWYTLSFHSFNVPSPSMCCLTISSHFKIYLNSKLFLFPT